MKTHPNGRLSAKVLGPPVAYGNKRGFVNPRTGGVIIAERNSQSMRSWQDALRQSMQRDAPAKLLRGPVAFSVSYYLARPKSHFRKDGSLNPKGQRSSIPTKKPDGDKVARAAADCGTGIWYVDDAQIAQWRIEKWWTTTVGPTDARTPEHTHVTAHALVPEEA